MKITEGDLQHALDVDPRDTAARLALAELLEAAGDQRAPGYRAMAEGGMFPHAAPGYGTPGAAWYWWDFGREWTGPSRQPAPNLRIEHGEMPSPWYAALSGGEYVDHRTCGMRWPTRRAAEDAAAAAFGRLPAVMRQAVAGEWTEVAAV